MITIDEKVDFFKKIVLDRLDYEYQTLEESLDQSFQSEIENFKEKAQQKSENYIDKFVTKVPTPCFTVIAPQASNSFIASRTELRLTPRYSLSSSIEGKRAPMVRCLAVIRSRIWLATCLDSACLPVRRG